MDMRLLPLPPEPFDDPRIHGESAAFMPIVRRVLGDDCRLLFVGLVSTEPGTAEQALHADGPHVADAWAREASKLNGETKTAAHGQHPCHCLTVFLPLVDLTAENGATKYLPGTQHSVIATAALEAEASEAGSSSGAGAAACLELRAGDAVIFDYRLFHAGGANKSRCRRPILYLIFAKPWFQDTFNFASEEVALGKGGGEQVQGGRRSGRRGGRSATLPTRAAQALGRSRRRPKPRRGRVRAHSSMHGAGLAL